MFGNYSLFAIRYSLKMCTFAPAWKDRGVAQLVAFLVWDQAVAGSSPVTSTKKIGIPAESFAPAGVFV